MRILGELGAPDIESPDVGTTEDQGSITLATDTGIPADADGATITSEIGDGPHGEAGTGNGDFDFFKVTAAAGQTLIVNTAGSDMDTVAAVWDSVGTLLAFGDDVAPGDLTTKLRFLVPADGDYYAMIGGFSAFPEDPLTPGAARARAARVTTSRRSQSALRMPTTTPYG